MPAPPPQPAHAPTATVFQDSLRPEKAKLPPAEMAKQLVQEIWKTPPKLFLYSIAGAVLIIVLVTGRIYFRIHSGSSDGSSGEAQLSVPAAAQDQGTDSSGERGAPGRSAVLQAPTPVEAMRESGGAAPSVIAVTPRYVKRRGKTPPPAPVVIPGQLTVNSTPEGAQVLVDGHHNPTWVTPFNMTGLGPGQHIVSVNKLGFAPETRTIEVASGSKSFW